MSIVLQSSGGGSVTLQEPSTASNVTVTIPAATGDVMVSGNMPAFRAYLGTTQNVSSSTNTKVNIDTEVFDTNNCFDTSTNRFTPNVAGYYQVTGHLEIDASLKTRTFCLVYKNGSAYAWSNDGVMTTPYMSIVTTLVYLNGTTDYVEFYGWVNGTSTQFYSAGTGVTSNFQAVLVRGA
jgi:hypothetical protein